MTKILEINGSEIKLIGSNNLGPQTVDIIRRALRSVGPHVKLVSTIEFKNVFQSPYSDCLGLHYRGNISLSLTKISERAESNTPFWRKLLKVLYHEIGHAIYNEYGYVFEDRMGKERIEENRHYHLLSEWIGIFVSKAPEPYDKEFRANPPEVFARLYSKKMMERWRYKGA